MCGHQLWPLSVPFVEIPLAEIFLAVVSLPRLMLFVVSGRSGYLAFPIPAVTNAAVLSVPFAPLLDLAALNVLTEPKTAHRAHHFFNSSGFS